MTTGSSDVQATETEFDINKLIDKPYSEMTDAEIEFVIEWKAGVKARDAQFQATLQTIHEGMQAQQKAMQEQANKDAERQDALLQASIERMKRANGGA